MCKAAQVQRSVSLKSERRQARAAGGRRNERQAALEEPIRASHAQVERS